MDWSRGAGSWKQLESKVQRKGPGAKAKVELGLTDGDQAQAVAAPQGPVLLKDSFSIF